MASSTMTDPFATALGAGVVPVKPPAPTPTPTPPPKPEKTAEQLQKEAEARANQSQLDAEARAIARENEAKAKAGKRYMEQAGNLDAQIAALREALTKSFGSALEQNLRDVDMNLKQQLDILKSGAAERAKGFLGTARDTELATATQAEGSFANLLRERQDSMSAILEHGVGETDALRSMVMAARNWQANAAEGNRTYFDTMRSVNNGITDLNMDTQTALANTATSAETERERLWQDFYNKRSESYTQLGNTLGQQRDYYAQAKEMGVDPGDLEWKTKYQAEQQFMNAANEAGKSYVQQGLPSWIKDYKGQPQLKAEQNNTNLAAAVEFEPLGKAEGAASLARW